MVKVLQKVFNAVVKQLKNSLPTLGESGSEVSQCIPKPRNFVEVFRLISEAKKAWIKASLK